jgi:hypothetical protein
MVRRHNASVDFRHSIDGRYLDYNVGCLFPGGAMSNISFAQGELPKAVADQPYTMEFYYRVQWGHQQEFLQLFLKNHYPLLKKEAESGRMISVRIEAPALHVTEDARWDFRVTLQYKNSKVATTTNPEKESLIRQLWPDQETFQREEQRRFEILLAHWDLPITDITPRE